MLVLSRKHDQAVVVGDVERLANILKVTVLKITGGRVWLGFETDKDVPVHRGDVWERMGAGGAREPPSTRFRARQPKGADGSARMLSETGKGRSPQPPEDRA